MNGRFLHHPALLNYLEFLRTHRGEVCRADGTIAVNSSRPEFTFLIAERIPDVMAHAHSLHLLPEAKDQMPGLLERGYAAVDELRFMIRSTPPSLQGMPSGIHISAARSLADFEDFSEVQGRGFCDTVEEFNDWHPWLREANFRNRERQGQTFHVAYLGERPVSVALSIHHASVLGIYAVATLPAFRGRGYSTAVMDQIAREAMHIGVTELILQVAGGSRAEAFYEHLGFSSAFSIAQLKKPS